jgi:hypothetical protein
MTELITDLYNPSIMTATDCIKFSISVIGLFLNCLAVYITIFRYNSRNAAIWLIVYIAIIDILFSTHDIVTQILKWITNHQVLLYSPFCQYSGMLYALLIMTSVDGVGILSLLRAMSIVGDIELRAVYWYIAIGTLTLINVTLSALGVVYNIMKVMPSGSYCKAGFGNSQYSRIYSIIIIAKFFIMMLLTMISYSCITVKYYRTVSRLRSKNSNNRSSRIANRPVIIYQRWIIIRLLALILMYMTCFLPELVIIFYNVLTDTDRTPIVDSISSSWLSFTIIVNSVFVLLYHKETRNILANMLPSWIPLYRPNTNITELNNF